MVRKREGFRWEKGRVKTGKRGRFMVGKGGGLLWVEGEGYGEKRGGF